MVDLKCACTDVFLEVSTGLYSPRIGQNMAVFYGSHWAGERGWCSYTARYSTYLLRQCLVELNVLTTPC